MGSRLIACELIDSNDQPIKAECVRSAAGFYYLKNCASNIKTVRYRLEQISSGKSALIEDARWFSQPIKSFDFQKQGTTQILLPLLDKTTTLEDKLAIINNIMCSNVPVYTYSREVGGILERAGVVTSLLPDQGGSSFNIVGHALTFAIGAEGKLILSDPTSTVNSQYEIDEKSLTDEEWHQLKQEIETETLTSLFPKLVKIATLLKKQRTADITVSQGSTQSINRITNTASRITFLKDIFYLVF